jgi:hypothetical protein
MNENEQNKMQQVSPTTDKDTQAVTAIGALLTPIVQSVTDAQKTVATENTKQTEIRARENTRQTEIAAATTRQTHFGLAAICVLTFAVAIIALFMGKDQLTEKMVFSLLGFMGGVGVGKYQSKT